VSRFAPALSKANVVGGSTSKPAVPQRGAEGPRQPGIGQVLLPRREHRRMRSGSPLCQTIESQSVSSTSTRPPGAARADLGQHGGTSGTYSSTCVATATSTESSASGSASAEPSRISRARRASGRAPHALARVDGEHAAARFDAAASRGQEARSGPDVQHVLAGPQREQAQHLPPLGDQLGRRVGGFRSARGLGVESQMSVMRPGCQLDLRETCGRARRARADRPVGEHLDGRMNADERRFAVLRAIVADYVATHEPVGSKMIVDRHNLGRLQRHRAQRHGVLEEDGLIAQPHTSAGRVPTDKGYRVFVDRLTQVKPLSTAERRAVQAFLDGALDLDDVMRRSVRLLAQLTRQVAVVQYPTLTRSTVRHCEVVALTPARLMLVLITDSGRVDQRVVDLGEVLSDDDVAACAPVNGALVGQAARRGLRGRRRAARSAPRRLRGVVTTVASVLIETLVEHPRSARCSAAPPTSPATRPTSPLPAPDPGGAGGAGRGAQAAGLGAGSRARSPCASAARTRPRRCATRRCLDRLRTRTVLGGMGVVGPTGWTIRGRSRRCMPSLGT
jgi:heat-inducible transcriptional repressor